MLDDKKGEYNLDSSIFFDVTHCVLWKNLFFEGWFCYTYLYHLQQRETCLIDISR